MTSIIDSTLYQRRILVTGATGLVGKHLCHKLHQCGARITAVEHETPLATYYPDEYFDNIIYGSLEDELICQYATENIEYVCHCAANTAGAAVMAATPLVHVTPNIIMNARLLEAAYKNGVKKFLWLSSTTGYPEQNSPVTEDQMFVGEPYSSYYAVGWMKRYTEVLCKLYSTQLNPKMLCLVLRPTNIYGPGDKFDLNKCHVLPALINKICNKLNPVPIWGDGTETRDLIYVDDMVKAILRALVLQEIYQPLNIGYGNTFSIKDLAKIICALENFDPQIEFQANKPRMIKNRTVNIEKANHIIGWRPTTNIITGLLQTINWYKENYVNNDTTDDSF